MKKIKVFISSVIEDYEDRRDAAEEAVLELNRDQGFNFEAIRIEPSKYPAVNKTPQKACLDGVKECDIYLGIYPRNNYGWQESPVGISPTDEEFLQAVKDDKYRLVFVENTEKIDFRQKEFLKKVGEYVEGRFWNEFESGNVDELKHRVYRALWNFMKANFEECRLNYLNAILKQYKQINRPWECSLPVSEIVQLELILIEQKQEEKELSTRYDENERHLEKLPKSLLFSDVIQENQRLLIIGDPGAGKSTSLQWITYSYAEQILSSTQKKHPVPIYLELWSYDDSLLELIVDSFSEKGITCDEETITDWIKRGEFIFLLDGFDELDNPSKCLKEIKHLLAFSQENQFVVASRKMEQLKDLQNLQFKKVEVKQLSDSQIELFIENYLGKEKGSKLLKELEKYNLLKEARNPLILWFMILEIQGEESQISINRGMLFKNVIEQRFLKKWERKHAKDDNQKYTDLKINILSQLAFSLIEKGDSVKIKEEKAEEIIYNLLKEGRRDYKELGNTIEEQLLASRLLIKVSKQVSFWHRSFRDYFAALELLKLFSRDPEEFVKRYATKRWEEPILFLVGIMDDPSDFVNRLVQPFWRYFIRSRYPNSFRLSLAAKCIGASNRLNIETQQKVIELLTRIIQMEISQGKREIKVLFFPVLFDVDNHIQALGETKSETVAELMGEFLENHDCEQRSPQWVSCGFCRQTVEALRNLPLTEKVQNSLLYAALRHKDNIVKDYTAEIFRENITRETALKLVRIMLDKDEKCYIRERAIRIMCGKILTNKRTIRAELKLPEIVIDPLIQIALQEACDDIRKNAADALGYYRGEDKEDRIVNPLIHALLKNSDANIRANAVYALIFQFAKNGRDAIILALDDENERVRGMAAYALKLVGHTLEEQNEVSSKLLKLFSDENTDVRIQALWTFGNIRKNPTSKEVTQLINLLKDEEPSIRWGAARALGLLKAKSALGALIQMVWDEKCDYPWAYAIWATVQIEPVFSEVVKENGWEDAYIKDIHDDDADKRVKATEILGKIGTEKSLPVLKELCKDYKKKSGKEDRAIDEIEARIRP